jgi:hypothetical protein
VSNAPECRFQTDYPTLVAEETKMTTLTAAKRDDAKTLLEDHQLVCDALDHVGKATWATSMYLIHDDGDDVTVNFNHTIAKKALSEQRGWIEKELAKLGIEIK